MYKDQYSEVAQAKCVSIPNRTLTETLNDERARLEARLDEINACLTALEGNTAVRDVLNLLQKNRCI